jgi:hypothetical protein
MPCVSIVCLSFSFTMVSRGHKYSVACGKVDNSPSHSGRNPDEHSPAARGRESCSRYLAPSPTRCSQQQPPGPTGRKRYYRDVDWLCSGGCSFVRIQAWLIGVIETCGDSGTERCGSRFVGGVNRSSVTRICLSIRGPGGNKKQAKQSSPAKVEALHH